MIGTALLVPCLTLSAVLKGFLWLTHSFIESVSRGWKESTKQKTWQPSPPRRARRKQQIQKRREWSKTLRRAGRIRRTWREVNRKIEATHGKAVGWACLPETHHLLCHGLRFGWYVVLLLLVVGLMSYFSVLATDTFVFAWISITLLGLRVRLRQYVVAAVSMHWLHHITTAWLRYVNRKLKDAGMEQTSGQTVFARTRVVPRKQTLDQQRLAEKRRWQALQQTKRRSKRGRGGHRKFVNLSIGPRPVNLSICQSVNWAPGRQSVNL